MSHNLAFDQKSQEYQMFCATGKRGLPWHHLGQLSVSAQSFEQVAKLAHMDFSVSKHQLYNPLEPTKLIDSYGVFRDDTKAFLGNVGSVYQCIQIAQAFDFVDSLLEAEKGAHYESAGVLNGGSRFWVLARVPYSIKIENTKDHSDVYILFESSHDGTLSAIAKLTIVRVVCQNTLTQALSSTGMASLKIKHSSNGTEKLEAAKKMISGIKQSVDSISEKLNILAHRKLTPKVNTAIMTEIFGEDWKESSRKREQIENIARLFSSNDNNAIPEIRGSALNLLNGFTEYSDHYKSVRITSGKEGMNEKQVRAQGALFGGAGEQLKNQALETILEMTSKCEVIDNLIENVKMPTPKSGKIENILSLVK